MNSYQLTFIDKIYFIFEDRYINRYAYLYPKVEKHQLNWFYKNKIKLPLNFDRYVSNYTKCLLDLYID